MTPTLVQRRVVFEAMRLEPGTDDYKDVCDWIARNRGEGVTFTPSHDGAGSVTIVVDCEDEGVSCSFTAGPGDWIVRREFDFDVLSAKDFHATWIAVPPAVPDDEGARAARSGLGAMRWDGTRPSIERLCRWVNDGPPPPTLPGEEPCDEPLLTYTFTGPDDVDDVLLAEADDFVRVLPGDVVLRDATNEVHRVPADVLAALVRAAGVDS